MSSHGQWTNLQDAGRTFADQMQSLERSMARISTPDCRLIYLQAEQLGGSPALLVPCILKPERDSIQQFAYVNGSTYRRILGK